MEKPLSLSEDVRLSTRLVLESRFSSKKLFNANLLPDVRGVVLDLVSLALLSRLAAFSPGSVHVAGDVFKSATGRRFKITIVPNVRALDELMVCLYPDRRSSEKMRDSRRKIRTPLGGYSRLTLTSSKTLEVRSDEVLEIVESTISASYEWIFSRIVNLGRDSREKLTEALYQIVYELLPNSKLIESLWLGFVHDNKCYYLLDRRRIQLISERLSAGAREIGAEPLELASAIVGMDLPFEKSATHSAFEKKSAMDVSLGRLSYSDQTPILSTAESVIYSSEDISVIPICILENAHTFLVAFCPKSDRSEWVDFFSRHCDTFKTVLSEHFSSLKKIVKAATRITSTSDHARLLGDTLGHFTATFFRRILNL